MKARQAGSIYYLLIINGDDYCHLDLHSMFEFIPPWFSWLGAACLDQACGRAASPGGPGGPGGSGGNGGDGGGAGDLLQIYPTGLSSLFCTKVASQSKTAFVVVEQYQHQETRTFWWHLPQTKRKERRRSLWRWPWLTPSSRWWAPGESWNHITGSIFIKVILYRI